MDHHKVGLTVPGVVHAALHRKAEHIVGVGFKLLVALYLRPSPVPVAYLKYLNVLSLKVGNKHSAACVYGCAVH